MSEPNIKYPDFKKSAELLIPVVIQDAVSKMVLMLGYVNEEAFNLTIDSKRVTFFSRSKNRLWTKGETSGNYLYLVEWYLDCDNDALLFLVNPNGPTCHTGKTSCFQNFGQEETFAKTASFVHQLESVIAQRASASIEESYVAKLLSKGINKVAQKVGEEAVELVIEAKDPNKDLFLGEAADLLFHYLVLLRAKGIQLSEVEELLITRHQTKKSVQ